MEANKRAKTAETALKRIDCVIMKRKGTLPASAMKAMKVVKPATAALGTDRLPIRD